MKTRYFRADPDQSKAHPEPGDTYLWRTKGSKKWWLVVDLVPTYEELDWDTHTVEFAYLRERPVVEEPVVEVPADKLVSLWHDIGKMARTIEDPEAHTLSAADQCDWLYQIMVKHGWEIQ